MSAYQNSTVIFSSLLFSLPLVVYCFCLFVFVQDLLQYYTNLTQANIRGTPRWILEYKATSAFSIPDVTTQSLHKLAETFKEVGSENFKKYYKFNSVSYDEECNDTCKVSQICAITKVDFDEYDGCVFRPQLGMRKHYSQAAVPNTNHVSNFSMRHEWKGKTVFTFHILSSYDFFENYNDKKINRKEWNKR